MNFRNKPRKKRSVIWETTKEDFEELVKRSTSIGQILKHYGLKNKGGNHHTVRRRIKEEDVDDSHITRGLNSNKERRFPNRYKFTLEEVLIENSQYNNGALKKRLIREGILEEICDECDLENVWNDKPIVLQLDHINGNRNDHRLENLRILCPNCHTQTPTYGRKKREYENEYIGTGVAET